MSVRVSVPELLPKPDVSGLGGGSTATPLSPQLSGRFSGTRTTTSVVSGETTSQTTCGTTVEKPGRRGGMRLNWDMMEELEVLALLDTPIPDRPWFGAMLSLEAIVNLIVLGASADHFCRRNCSESDNNMWLLLERCICAAFALDISATILLLGPRRFFKNGGHGYWTWNAFRIFDLFLVMCRVLDMLFAFGDGKAGLKVVSSLRIMHVGPFAKKFHSFRGFRELWLIMNGIADTMKSVAWVTLLLSLLLWVSATGFTISTRNLDYGDLTTERAASWSNSDYWDTVPNSLFTLFTVLTNDAWSEGPVWPLVESSPLTILFFITFACVGGLALLNTVVGVIVESTLRSVRASNQMMAEVLNRTDTRALATLERLFRESDLNDDGDLSIDELGTMVADARVKRTLKTLNLSVTDLESLYDILNEDQKGSVDLEIFFRNSLRLRGPAMTKDVYDVSMSLDRQRSKVVNTTKSVSKLKKSMVSLMKFMTGMEVDMVHLPGDSMDPALTSRRKHVYDARRGIAEAKHQKLVEAHQARFGGSKGMSASGSAGGGVGGGADGRGCVGGGGGGGMPCTRQRSASEDPQRHRFCETAAPPPAANRRYPKQLDCGDSEEFAGAVTTSATNMSSCCLEQWQQERMQLRSALKGRRSHEDLSPRRMLQPPPPPLPPSLARLHEGPAPPLPPMPKHWRLPKPSLEERVPSKPTTKSAKAKAKAKARLQRKASSLPPSASMTSTSTTTMTMATAPKPRGAGEKNRAGKTQSLRFGN